MSPRSFAEATAPGSTFGSGGIGPVIGDTLMMVTMMRLTSVLLLLCLSGCAPAASDRGPVEIRYWTGWTGHELDAQKRLVEEFNRTHTDVRVRILSVAGSYQKVRIAFAGAATPDVVSAVWADELAGYAMRGVLSPLDDRLRESG